MPDPGKDIWLFGGGSLFGSLLDFGMVDAIGVAAVPVLLGGGTPRLPARSRRTRLRLVSTRAYRATGTMNLESAVEHEHAEPGAAAAGGGMTASPGV